MEIEHKLDEDFLFYLGFTNSFRKKVEDCSQKQLCHQWLQRLCGESFNTVESKRNRNIFLSNLLLQMQSKALREPFTLLPENVDLLHSEDYFPALYHTIAGPDWLYDVVEGQDDTAKDEEQPRNDGRTYVATRVMPDNKGAFAYVAVNLAEEQPMWLGGGEGIFDAEMEFKYKQVFREPFEMELLLAKRKDVKERQRVLTFYDVIMQNIADELDEKITSTENTAITAVMEQFIKELRVRGKYAQYEEICDAQTRRNELLLALFEKTKSRRDKVAKREEYLDEIEASMRSSFFDSSMEEEDKYEMPAQMWEYAINRPPNQKKIEIMQQTYPEAINKKFMELLSDQKENIAVKMQKRHNLILSQMKKELRKEGEALKRKVDESKMSMDQALSILNDVKEALAKQEESIEKEKNRKKGGETHQTKLYNELRATLVDTQLLVEDEAARGRLLSHQINQLNVQSGQHTQITECSIIKTEEANMGLMRNIKRLNAAITQHETRLSQIQHMREQALASRQKQVGNRPSAGAMLYL